MTANIGSQLLIQFEHPYSLNKLTKFNVNPYYANLQYSKCMPFSFFFICYENKIFLETNFTKMELFQETFRKDSMIAKLKSNLKQIFI